MHKIIRYSAASLLLAICLWQHDAGAQQAPPDARVEAYRQLLLRANDDLAQVMAQAHALSTENASLKADLAKLKGDDKPKPEAPK